MISQFIKLCHLLIVAFIVLTPFVGNEYFLSLHVLIIPFILIHWITNQSVCALTEIEKFITKKPEEDTFFGRLVGPVYKFRTKDEEQLFLYVLMGALFTMTFIKLQSMGFVQLKADFARFLELFSPPQTPPPPPYPDFQPHHPTQSPSQPLQA